MDPALHQLLTSPAAVQHAARKLPHELVDQLSSDPIVPLPPVRSPSDHSTKQEYSVSLPAPAGVQVASSLPPGIQVEKRKLNRSQSSPLNSPTAELASRASTRKSSLANPRQHQEHQPELATTLAEGEEAPVSHLHTSHDHDHHGSHPSESVAVSRPPSGAGVAPGAQQTSHTVPPAAAGDAAAGAPAPPPGPSPRSLEDRGAGTRSARVVRATVSQQDKKRPPGGSLGALVQSSYSGADSGGRGGEPFTHNQTYRPQTSPSPSPCGGMPGSPSSSPPRTGRLPDGSDVGGITTHTLQTEPSYHEPSIYMKFHFPKIRMTEKSYHLGSDLKYDHYDAWVDWPMKDVSLDTTAWSSNVKYHRMLFSKRSGERYVSKEVPVHHGMDYLPLWKAYSASSLTEPMDIEEICRFVYHLRPRSVHDLKPLLILTQSLLKDFLEGNRSIYSHEIGRLARMYESKIEELLRQISVLSKELGREHQTSIKSKFISAVRRSLVTAKEDTLDELRLAMEADKTRQEEQRKELEKVTRDLDRAKQSQATLQKQLQEANARAMQADVDAKEAIKELNQIRGTLTPEVLAHLQNPELAKLLSNPDFLSAVLHDNFRMAGEEKDFSQWLSKADFLKALGNPNFQGALGHPGMLRACGDQAFLKACGDSNFLYALNDPNFLRALGNQEFLSALGNPDFLKACGNSKFQGALGTSTYLSALGDPRYISSLGQGGMMQLLGNEGFKSCLNNPVFIKSLSDREVQAKLCNEEAMAELLEGRGSVAAQMRELHETLRQIELMQDLADLCMPDEVLEDVATLASSEPSTILKRWLNMELPDNHSDSGKRGNPATPPAIQDQPYLLKLANAMMQIKGEEIPKLPQHADTPEVIQWIKEHGVALFSLPDKLITILSPDLMHHDENAINVLAGWLFAYDGHPRSLESYNALEKCRVAIQEAKEANDGGLDEEAMNVKLGRIRGELEGLRSKMAPGDEAYTHACKHLAGFTLAMTASKGNVSHCEAILSQARDFKEFSNLNWERLNDIGITDEDKHEILELLEIYFQDFRNIYKHYAVGGDMSASEINALVKDCKLLDKNLIQGKVDVIFARCNVTEASATPGAKKADKNLESKEYMEALIRYAHAKYEKSGKSISDMFEKMMTDCVFPNARQASGDEFRAIIDQDEIRDIMGMVKEPLTQVFKHYAAADNKTSAAAANRLTINVNELEKMLKEAEAMAGGRLQRSDLPRLMGNVQSDDDTSEVNLAEFRELLCAASLYFEPNPYVPIATRIENFLSKVLLPGLKDNVTGLKVPNRTAWRRAKTRTKMVVSMKDQIESVRSGQNTPIGAVSPREAANPEFEMP